MTRAARRDHGGLGHGVHHCLGAPLARMEAIIALSQLFERFPDLALAEPDHRPEPRRPSSPTDLSGCPYCCAPDVPDAPAPLRTRAFPERFGKALVASVRQAAKAAAWSRAQVRYARAGRPVTSRTVFPTVALAPVS